ncbi:MAG TPA: glycosyltransferase [Ignavibacteriales bacterium]|nr:glycosyltransferase [Ignavibacteriales bacterium]
MRVLLITARADFGGGPRHVDDLINNLLPEYELYLASPGGVPYYNKWKSNVRVKEIYEIPFRAFSVKSLSGLIRFAKRNKIDIIHSHGRGAGVYSRLLKIFLPETRVVHTMHGFHFDDYPAVKKAALITIEKILALFTDKVIAVSNGEKKSVEKYGIYDKKKIAVIYNGIEEWENAISASELRKKLGLPAGNYIVLSAARFGVIKNITMILEIAARLREREDITFVIIGDGEEFSAMQKLRNSRNLQNVSLPGFKENVLEYMKASDVYLSTSIREGMPISLIEACMLGVPVIASDVTGNNEIVDDGINGFLFKLDDVETPVNKILKLSADKEEARRLSANAVEIYRQKFAIKKMIKKVEEIYALNNKEV